jgi:hypothetical protein
MRCVQFLHQDEYVVPTHYRELKTMKESGALTVINSKGNFQLRQTPCKHPNACRFGIVDQFLTCFCVIEQDTHIVPTMRLVVAPQQDPLCES